MFKAMLLGAALLTTSFTACAQENLVGDWGGSYVFKGGRREVTIGVEVKITSVEGNAVKGSAKVFNYSCAGDYDMRGKLDGKNLGMISTNTAGSAGDCKFGFRGTVEGNSIKAMVGTSELNLTKK